MVCVLFVISLYTAKIRSRCTPSIHTDSIFLTGVKLSSWHFWNYWIFFQTWLSFCIIHLVGWYNRVSTLFRSFNAKLSHFSLVWFYGTSTIVGYWKQNPFSYIYIYIYINISISKRQFNISAKLKCQKSVLFQAIRFSIRTLFNSIWPTDRTLSGAIIPSQNGLGSDGIKEVLRIPKSSSITETSLSDCLMSKLEHRLLGGVLFLWRDTVGIFCRRSQLC